MSGESSKTYEFNFEMTNQARLALQDLFAIAQERAHNYSHWGGQQAVVGHDFDRKSYAEVWEQIAAAIATIAAGAATLAPVTPVPPAPE